MLIGRVAGDLSATQKHASHPVVALDGVGAGLGDRVLLIMDGYAASTALGLKLAPIDAAVVGIIDRIELAQE